MIKQYDTIICNLFKVRVFAQHMGREDRLIKFTNCERVDYTFSSEYYYVLSFAINRSRCQYRYKIVNGKKKRINGMNSTFIKEYTEAGNREKVSSFIKGGYIELVDRGIMI